MTWIRTFVTTCASVLALVFIALVLLVSFVDLGLSGHGVTALFIGTLLTIALTMILMGLLFMSDRGGRDASVHAAGIRRAPQEDSSPPRQALSASATVTSTRR